MSDRPPRYPMPNPHDAQPRRDRLALGPVGAHPAPRSPHRRPASPPSRGVRRAKAILLNASVGLAALAVAVATFLAIAPPTELVRDRIIAEVKNRTGRDLVIAGSTHFTMLPGLGITATDVSLSAPPEMPGDPLLTAAKLEVSIALLPMLLRDVQVERFVLHRPHITLRVDQSGRRSWDFAAALDLQSGNRVQLAQATPRRDLDKRSASELDAFAKNATIPIAPRANALDGVNGVSLGDVRIVDGRVTWSDLRAGTLHEIERLEARVSLPDPAGPLDLTGSLVHAGERFDIGLKLASLRDAAAARETKTRLDIKGASLRLDYDGLLTAGAKPVVDGRISLSTTSMEALVRLARLELVGAADQAIALEGQIKGHQQNFSLSGAQLTFGSTALQGRIGVDTTAARPQIQAALKVSLLDVDHLGNLALRSAPATPAAHPVPRISAPPPPATSPRSIEELIERTPSLPPATSMPGPAVRGFARRAGEAWSVEPMSSAALRVIDIDARLEVDRVVWKQQEIGSSQSALTLKAGVLKANVSDARMFGGRAKGLITLDAQKDTLVVGANLSADGVSVLPFLSTVANIDSLDGRGRVVIAVSAQGSSERELVSSLTGKAELNVADGAVIGWSANDITASLSQGRLPNLDRNAAARTPFTELSASLPIASGVGRTQDIRLKSPTLEATGSGTVNMVDQNIDLMLKPKATGTSGLAGIEIPVRIAGPWSDVKAIPDVNAAMKSPQAQEAARRIGKQLQGGDLDGALRTIIGDGPKADEKVGKAKDALKQLFGR